MDSKKNDNEYKKIINKCMNFVNQNIAVDKFNISKIDINTKNKNYYMINVLYLDKIKKEQLFSEYIIEKREKNILHFLSNEIILHRNNVIEKESKKEVYTTNNIAKIFYKNEWVTISENNIRNCIKETFGNIDDFYELLNKEYYYTYIVKESKIIFLSKGKTNNINLKYNENIDNILYNEFYILINKELNNNKNCKYKIYCINPRCVYKHPLDYNLDKAYKNYILNEKNKNPKFKSADCKYKDELCENHKKNKCIFKHNNDPKI